MRIEQIDTVIDLIANAMNAEEAEWAGQTLDFYFACLAKGLDPAREYFVIQPEQKLIGIVGLHYYRWGPPENVWLSWFAVDPGYQGQGYARAMLTAIESYALQRGYRKFFIETYASTVFEKALGFYQHMGFQAAGHISDYLADGSRMCVLYKRLSDSG